MDYCHRGLGTETHSPPLLLCPLIQRIKRISSDRRQVSRSDLALTNSINRPTIMQSLVEHRELGAFRSLYVYQVYTRYKKTKQQYSSTGHKKTGNKRGRPRFTRK